MTVSKVLNEMPLDSKVNMREVAILDETRIITTSNNEDIFIHMGHFLDETDNITLTLWREYCPLLKNRVSDDLQNVVKMKYSGEIRLQTCTTYMVSEEQIEEYNMPNIYDSRLRHS